MDSLNRVTGGALILEASGKFSASQGTNCLLLREVSPRHEPFCHGVCPCSATVAENPRGNPGSCRYCQRRVSGCGPDS